MRFRLEDVPAYVRRRYGRRLVELATLDGDLPLAVELQRAIEFPSGRSYWITESAWQRVIG